MTLTLTSTTRAWRVLLALAGVTAAFHLAADDANAAGPRPLFQMPVPCGQTWEASTYKEHWNGDPDAIDLAQRDPDRANISEGEPALASAAGTVLEAYETGNGEYRVFLDHGGGWETHYVHLESIPPLDVGQSVAQGEMIGRISNSGSEEMHLHYNQVADGKLVRIRFDGKAIDTYAGNEDSYGTWDSDDAEELTSMNCPSNSFVAFNQNGLRYQLLYRPATGGAKVVRLKQDGKGVSSIWEGTLGQRYTHLVPFTLVGGQQHLFAYRASTGEVRFDRINPQANGTTPLASGTWWKGWTNVTPFSLGGKPYFLAYDSLHGYANIDRVNSEGSGSTKIYGSTWTKGWTHLTPYVLGGKQYVLLYKGGTGEAKVIRLAGSGSSVTVTTAWSGAWSAGWTQLVPLHHKGTVRLFAYRAATGEVSYGKMRADGQGSQPLRVGIWSGTWTSFTPFLQDGRGGLFVYSAGSGVARTRLLNLDGTGSDVIWQGSWTRGWA